VDTHSGVVVFGHYGQLNLGDEAVTAACISGVRQTLPGAQVLGFSLDPIDTQLKHAVSSRPIRVGDWRNEDRRPPDAALDANADSATAIRRAARRVGVLRSAVLLARRWRAAFVRILREIASLPGTWNALAGVRILVIAGSNQMMDHFGGAWGFPYTLLKWSIAARLRGVRVVMLSVGAGPLEGSLARRMILRTLSLTSYVSVRDPGSARLLAAIGWDGAAPVMPDLAFSLEFEAMARRSRFSPSNRSGRPLVAINPMPVHDPRYWPGADPQIQREYLESIERLVIDLLDRDYDVVMLGTQPADEWVAEDLLQRLHLPVGRRERVSLERIRTLEEFCGLYAICDAVVATRFHGILIALRAAKPVLAICYYRKSRELMESFGLGAYAVDLDKLGAAPLIEMFVALVSARDAIREQMRAGVEQRRSQLSEQYCVALTAVPRTSGV
jgi:polysaccharide pyruvyl transferase WcaK-like protein